MPDFRRGREALEESARQAEENKGSFKPFAPNIAWSEPDEERYLTFLTSIDDATKLLMHRFIPLETYKGRDDKERTRYGFYISRKDPAIGEDHDILEDDLDRPPQERYLAVAVELEPTYGEGKRGQKRPVGFEVKTDTYERRIDPDDEDSDTEEITYPRVGLIDQAFANFFTFLSSHADSDGPIEDCAFRVKRIGKGTDTTYQFTPFFDQPVDLAPLFDTLDGISYLSDDEEKFAELISGVEETLESDDEEAETKAGLIVGNALLDRRLDELSDKERYEAEVADLTPDDVASKFGGKKNKGKGKSSGSKSRGSSRSKKSDDDSGKDEEKSGGGTDRKKFDQVKARAAERRRAREAKKEAAKD